METRELLAQLRSFERIHQNLVGGPGEQLEGRIAEAEKSLSRVLEALADPEMRNQVQELLDSVNDGVGSRRDAYGFRNLLERAGVRASYSRSAPRSEGGSRDSAPRVEE